MRYVFILFALLVTTQVFSTPEDVASRALRGEYGSLEIWQRNHYIRISKGCYRTVTVSLTKYQPRPVGWKSSPKPYGTPRWLDSRFGGPSVDCKGRLLREGDLAGSYPYGTVIWMNGKLRRLTDRFGSPQAKNRMDVCCLTAESYLSCKTGKATAYIVY